MDIVRSNLQLISFFSALLKRCRGTATSAYKTTVARGTRSFYHRILYSAVEKSRFAMEILPTQTQFMKHCYMNYSQKTSSFQEERARELWRIADAVCFDVDSTVCEDEAIDELARFAGREKEVADLTQKAMRGGISFREALSRRLDLIQPTWEIMKQFVESHSPRLTPGIRELIAELHNREIPVYLVSGGFDTIIEPVAEELDIPLNHIFANRIKYYFNGDYAGFDEDQLTCEQDGKSQVAAYLKHRCGYQRLVMIGDGVTDLVSSPPADLFIGFGGNQVREKVKKEARWFVSSFEELLEELLRN